MALTSELLKANAATAGLSDDQVKAVVEMSQNDENSVIGQKTGEIYGGLDADILAASGIAKEGAERTYDYAKRVIGQFKAQAGDAAGLNKQISDLTKEKARLEKVIAEGGADAETKAALTRAKTDLTNVTKEYTELKAKFDKSEETHKAALFGLQLDGEFAKASAGLKFKADLPAAVTDVLMQQAIAKVKGMNPEYIDDGKGGKGKTNSRLWVCWRSVVSRRAPARREDSAAAVKVHSQTFPGQGRRRRRRKSSPSN